MNNFMLLRYSFPNILKIVFQIGITEYMIVSVRFFIQGQRLSFSAFNDAIAWSS
jgi:hypothetical protein